MAFSFNGTNQSISANAAVLNASPITVACWAYPKNNTAAQCLISLGSSTSNLPLYQLRLRGDQPGDPVDAEERNDAGLFSRSIGLSFVTNTWQHFCGVFAATNNRQVWVNGAAGPSDTTDVAGAKTMNLTGLGCLIRNPSIQFYNGDMAEAAIWNAALTSDEIASLAKGFTPDQIRPQNLVFYAPLARNLIDVRRGLVITNNNSATVSDHPRVYA